jgi:hypothetical protein
MLVKFTPAQKITRSLHVETHNEARKRLKGRVTFNLLKLVYGVGLFFTTTNLFSNL